MAKQAKQVDKDPPDDVVRNAVNAVLERYDNIESERAKYMHAARREREAMGTVYESMTKYGVPQKAMKIEIKIIRAVNKIQGWLSDLETNEREHVLKLAKARNDSKQLTLFGETVGRKRPRRGKPTLGVVGAEAEKAVG